MPPEWMACCCLGGTGEGLLQTVEQRKLVAEAAVRNSPKGKLVIVHVGSHRTADAVELAAHAGRIGAGRREHSHASAGVKTGARHESCRSGGPVRESQKELDGDTLLDAELGKSVNHRTLLTAASLCLAAIVVSGQQSNGGGIFTSAQAASGRVAYEKTCGRCHTLALTGRQGNPEERPMVSSLSEADRKFIENYGGRVPPLAGKVFLQRWAAKTAAELVARFQEAKFLFAAAGSPTMRRLCT